MGAFNPNEHLRKLRGKDYLEVKWRLVWFHSDTDSKAGYITIELEHDRQAGYARYAAVAWDGKGDEWRVMKFYGMEVPVCGRVGTGVKSETKADFPDFTEKAETGALGRALAGISYGTQFAPDVEEGERIVDSPVQGRQQQQQPQQKTQPAPTAEPQATEGEQPANEQQLTSIRKLCAALGREEPDPNTLTVTSASALIRTLSRAYNERRKAS